jgi:hypothetical protein
VARSIVKFYYPYSISFGNFLWRKSSFLLISGYLHILCKQSIFSRRKHFRTVYIIKYTNTFLYFVYMHMCLYMYLNFKKRPLLHASCYTAFRLRTKAVIFYLFLWVEQRMTPPLALGKNSRHHLNSWGRGGGVGLLLLFAPSPVCAALVCLFPNVHSQTSYCTLTH